MCSFFPQYFLHLSATRQWFNYSYTSVDGEGSEQKYLMATIVENNATLVQGARGYTLVDVINVPEQTLRSLYISAAVMWITLQRNPLNHQALVDLPTALLCFIILAVLYARVCERVCIEVIRIQTVRCALIVGWSCLFAHALLINLNIEMMPPLMNALPSIGSFAISIPTFLHTF